MKDREIIEQAARLRCNGKTLEETAAELGVHRATLWRWAKSEVYAKAYDIQLRENLLEAELERYRRMKELEPQLKSRSAYVQMRAAKEIMDMFPFEKM